MAPSHSGPEPALNCATVMGKSSSEEAKIGGITPDELSFKGRWEASPWNMRLPICRLGYCTNRRRCARSMNTMAPTTASMSTTRPMSSGQEMAPCRDSSSRPASAVGRPATIPDMMMSDVPLPTPRAVICSPSHIRNMVPPTSVTTVEMRKNQPGSITTGLEGSRGASGPVVIEPEGDAVGLKGGQSHGHVAGVLVDLLAALLAFLLQLLERGHDARHELHDDGGGDVGHDVERKDCHALHGTPGEHVEHAEDAGRLGFEGLRERGRIDAGDRDVGAKPVDHERGQREPDALLELFGLGKGAEIQVGGKLLGGRNHLPLLGPPPPRAPRV